MSWTPEELNSLHDEVMGAATRAATDGATLASQSTDAAPSSVREIHKRPAELGGVVYAKDGLAAGAAGPTNATIRTSAAKNRMGAIRVAAVVAGMAILVLSIGVFTGRKSEAPVKDTPMSSLIEEQAKARAIEPDILKSISFDGRERLRVSRGGLFVEVDTEAAPGGKGRIPVATVSHAGRTVAVLKPRPEDGDIGQPSAEVFVVPLDAKTGLLQVIFMYFTGGAHCCTVTLIATGSAGGLWETVQADTLDGGGYWFEDIDGDGSVELISVDNSFLYAYDCYACSAAPTRIQGLIGSRLQDVTRETKFQQFLRGQLQQMEARSNAASSHSNGYLGGWVAAKRLVGEIENAWRTMLASYDRSSDWPTEECVTGVELYRCPQASRRRVSFPEALAKHLIRNGYITAQEARALAVSWR